MRWSACTAQLPLLLAAASGIVQLVAAHDHHSRQTGHGHDHGDYPVPRVVGRTGRRLLREMAAASQSGRDATAQFPAHVPPFSEVRPPSTHERSVEQEGLRLMAEAAKVGDVETGDKGGKTHQLLRSRQEGGRDGLCGPTNGNCAKGYCCSPEGWCGLSSDYCAAPDCLINYGSGCDANQKPSGQDTSNVPRPHVGSVLYGGMGIYDCVNNDEIAITFDDGPYKYTGDLLDKFASYGAKATFFITGNNLGKGMINDNSKPWAGFIKRMVAEGHQVASHTWSHQNASQLTADQYRNQIIWNEIALNDILGFFPTYMRPPYSICDAKCQRTLSDLGYHIIYFDLDTEGYLNDNANQIQTSKDIWDAAVNDVNPRVTDYLMIEHDIHYQTVYNLTDYVLTSLFAKGFRSVTVGECLGDPKENWYRKGPTGVPGAGVGGGRSTTTRPAAPTATPVPTIPGPPIPSTTIYATITTTTTTATQFTPRPTRSSSTTFRPPTPTIPSTTLMPPPSPSTPSTKPTVSPPTPPAPPPPPPPSSSSSSSAIAPAPPTSSSVSPVLPKPTASSTKPASSPPPSSSSVSAPPTKSAASSGTAVTSTGPSPAASDQNTASTAAPALSDSSPLLVTTDGRCGNGTTCLSSKFGNCCSISGRCGSTVDFCGNMCRPQYGACADTPR